MISIHAPVKGATAMKFGKFEPWNISIHAPVKGATLWLGLTIYADADFNPRTREGCDIAV